MVFWNSDNMQNESVTFMLNAIQSLQGAFLIDKADITSLYNFCPCKMLWEAISTNKSRRIKWEEIPLFLEDLNCSVYVFREPLQDLYYSRPFGHVEIDSKTLKDYFSRECAIKMEGVEIPLSNSMYEIPLYFFDIRLSWMLMLTGENNQDGTQLCVLVSI